MTKEFISKDQDFLTRKSTTYLTLVFLIPLCGLAIVALGYAIVYHEGRSRITKIGRISEGLSYMNTTSIMIGLVICILILIGVIAFVMSYYRNREIIVALKFDDQAKELTIRTKKIDGQEFVRTHKYSELLLAYNYLSDGMTPPMYNTLTLVKGNYLVGHIYVDHFTWDDGALSEIKIKLKNVL